MDVGTRTANEFYRVYDVESKEVLSSMLKDYSDAEVEARRIKNSTHKDKELFIARVTEVIYIKTRIIS